MLFRANKQKIPKLSDEETHTLTVTKEHLQNDKLPLSTFVNTLQISLFTTSTVPLLHSVYGSV